jgi:biopolymer transport protein TolR
MLVLLIIFMVAAPLMQQGIDVDLPETSTQALRVQDNPLILSVKKDGTYFLGKSEIQIENMVSKLEAIFEARASKEIYLRADKAAPYGTVVKAMAAAREAGSDQLGIVTEPEV